ncbi:hypothetical protein M9Y10_031479 [Tritrichomonas musculus]|uniref:Caspase family p20 domain-containing protein n=1 Tax=Tritrichomonas musculus TaxID=1915356 RepID=A0ABR2H0R8_9EUKA
MTYVDTPYKKQKHPHYEHRTIKLDRKDNQFSRKKFHRVRKVSTHKKLLKSFGIIGMCLNDKPAGNIPTGDLDKVCFILINDYEDDKNELGVGPLNDGYLIGLKHHRLGFKVFYLYNPPSDNFSTFLGFFMTNTTDSLTVFYTGREDRCDGIEFSNGSLSKTTISKIISQSHNKKSRVIFVTDCIGGGSAFNICGGTNLMAFSVNKASSICAKERKRSHGIFTYYFCKITSESPSITPNRLIERLNASLNRFNEVIMCEFTNKELGDSPIFVN